MRDEAECPDATDEDWRDYAAWRAEQALREALAERAADAERLAEFGDARECWPDLDEPCAPSTYPW